MTEALKPWSNFYRHLSAYSCVWGTLSLCQRCQDCKLHRPPDRRKWSCLCLEASSSHWDGSSLKASNTIRPRYQQLAKHINEGMRWSLKGQWVIFFFYTTLVQLLLAELCYHVVFLREPLSVMHLATTQTLGTVGKEGKTSFSVLIIRSQFLTEFCVGTSWIVVPLETRHAKQSSGFGFINRQGVPVVWRSVQEETTWLELYVTYHVPLETSVEALLKAA